jgi:hypothetical protein
MDIAKRGGRVGFSFPFSKKCFLLYSTNTMIAQVYKIFILLDSLYESLSRPVY